MSGTPAPAYIEYPPHIIQEELDVPPVRPPSAYRLVNQSAGGAEIAEAVKLARAAKSPILLVGHGVHTWRAHEPVAELAKLLGCPIIQTSGGTSFIQGVEDRTFPYGFLPSGGGGGVEADPFIV